MQPGGWTRIVTNLVGNSLKYTSKGTISVTLEMEEPTTEDGNRFCPVRLVIEDTGMDMSKQFLSNDLYTPFKQEDSHATGTGLGLSIVKQIAKDMNGMLDITSDLGKGTRCSLMFKTQVVATEEQFTDLHSSPPLQVAQRSYPLFHLLTRPSKPNSESHSHSSVGESVLNTAEAWLGCKVSSGPTLPDTSTTALVVAIAEHELYEGLAEQINFLPTVFAELREREARLLVLGGSLRATRLGQLPNEVSIPDGLFTSQPVDPQKLIRAMTSTQTSQVPADSAMFEHGDLKGLSLTNGAGDSAGVSASSVSGRAAPEKLQRPAFRPARTLSPTSRATELSSYVSYTQNTRSPPLTPLEAPTDEDSTSDTVLLVEDNDVNMKLLVVLMKRLKVSYQSAVNGQEALDAYRRTPSKFFLILMDMTMPVMDGFTSAVEIRKVERRHRLPLTKIVALTGVTSEEAKQRAFDCGMDEYFSKPVRMDELRNLIDRVQGRRNSPSSG